MIMKKIILIVVFNILSFSAFFGAENEDFDLCEQLKSLFRLRHSVIGGKHYCERIEEGVSKGLYTREDVHEALRKIISEAPADVGEISPNLSPSKEREEKIINWMIVGKSIDSLLTFGRREDGDLLKRFLEYKGKYSKSFRLQTLMVYFSLTGFQEEDVDRFLKDDASWGAGDIHTFYYVTFTRYIRAARQDGDAAYELHLLKMVQRVVKVKGTFDRRDIEAIFPRAGYESSSLDAVIAEAESRAKSKALAANPEPSTPHLYSNRLVFGAGAAIVLAAGTGILLWRRRRGKKKA